MEDITSLCTGLNINIGTLNERTIESMVRAGRKAGDLKKPIVFDPVGAGASALRTETARRLLSEIPFCIVRGNVSEIKTLFAGTSTTQGVDVNELDRITEANLEQGILLAENFAKENHCIVCISGEIDIVSDSEKTYVIRNGSEWMPRITGSGCMLSAMTAAFAAANQDNMLEAVAACTCAMGVCGELAEKRMADMDGNASFRNYLIDAVCHLDGEQLKEYGNIVLWNGGKR